ncbi:MAG: DUF4232 domain-containing protein [Chloroflexota bacterium]|nr:DUF4232 domain-containing protein [Chloroflexota bacterium]
MRVGRQTAGHGFRTLLAALVVGAAAALAACSGGGGSSRTATGTAGAPTTGTAATGQTSTPLALNTEAPSATVAGEGTATPVATVPAGVRACAAGDVTARVAEQGATGSLAGSIIITNASSTACTLSPPAGAVVPRVVIADARGIVLVTGSASASAGSTVLLKPGEKAFVVYVWSNWCGAAPAAPLKVTVSARQAEINATLGGGSGAAATPRCDNSAAPSSLSVGPFTHEQVR